MPAAWTLTVVSSVPVSLAGVDVASVMSGLLKSGDCRSGESIGGGFARGYALPVGRQGIEGLLGPMARRRPGFDFDTSGTDQHESRTQIAPATCIAQRHDG